MNDEDAAVRVGVKLFLNTDADLSRAIRAALASYRQLLRAPWDDAFEKLREEVAAARHEAERMSRDAFEKLREEAAAARHEAERMSRENDQLRAELLRVGPSARDEARKNDHLRRCVHRLRRVCRAAAWDLENGRGTMGVAKHLRNAGGHGPVGHGPVGHGPVGELQGDLGVRVEGKAPIRRLLAETLDVLIIGLACDDDVEVTLAALRAVRDKV
jgi:hypothetical protein